MLFYYQWRQPKNLQVGHSHNPGFPAHFHDTLEVLYLLEGRYAVKVDGTLYSLEAGDMVVVFPCQIHEYISVDGTNHELVIAANRMIMSEFLPMMTTQVPVCPVLRAAGMSGECKFLLEWLGRTTSSMPDAMSLRRSLFGALLWTLLHTLPLVERKESHRGMVQKIVRFCEENYSREDFSAQVVADELGYSRYYISHLFSRELNVSLSRYINTLRISHACCLLVESDMRIVDIAYACGYNSLRNFNRVFSMLMNTTPSAYRACPTAWPAQAPGQRDGK